MTEKGSRGIDSGLNYLHEEFFNSATSDVYNLWINPGESNRASVPPEPNGVDNDNNGYVDDIVGINMMQPSNISQDPDDTFGHGTHVAGIIGAAAGNAKGLVGTNWQVGLLPRACRRITE